MLPNAGVVPADDVGNYTNSDALRELINDFQSGYILSNGTTLSKSGDESITLISGDSVTAERVREIMITLRVVDTVARDSDGASPLRALLDIAEAGGRVDIEKIGGHDEDVLTRYGLGKESRELQWSEVRPSAMLNVPFLINRISGLGQSFLPRKLQTRDQPRYSV